MKKESSKIEVPKKTSLPETMKKYGGMFSIELESGFAHMKYEEDYKGRVELVVEWLNDEGYVEEDGHPVPFNDIERVANFMRELKEMRLQDYAK